MKQTILFAAGAMLLALVVARLPNRRLSWQGTGMLALKKVELPGRPFDPFFVLPQMHTVSNLVCTRDFHGRLAVRAGVNPKAFSFAGVRQLRSTSILDIDFVAMDSNTAERVASNACVMLSNLLMTKARATTEFVGVRVNRVPTLWMQALDEVLHLQKGFLP